MFLKRKPMKLSDQIVKDKRGQYVDETLWSCGDNLWPPMLQGMACACAHKEGMNNEKKTGSFKEVMVRGLGGVGVGRE